MSAGYSPLRYPGGKAKLGPFLSDVFKANRLVDGSYAEPYAGGAGAAMFLLFRGFAARVFLNDIDPMVVAFWRAVLNQTDRFAKAIERVPLTLAEWEFQRATFRARPRSFEGGFAFFYLNRTNRSGIMNAGVIGGRKQNGEWKIDARFNRSELASRVRAIGSLRRGIAVSNGDAIEFIADLQKRRLPQLLTYLDPPYFQKGKELYTNFYTPADHAAISMRLRRLRMPWLLTYDDCREIRALYRWSAIKESEVSYSAREVRRGREVLICGGGVRLPPRVRKRPRHGQGFTLLGAAR